MTANLEEIRAFLKDENTQKYLLTIMSMINNILVKIQEKELTPVAEEFGRKLEEDAKFRGKMLGIVWDEVDNPGAGVKKLREELKTDARLVEILAEALPFVAIGWETFTNPRYMRQITMMISSLAAIQEMNNTKPTPQVEFTEQ